MRVKLIKTIFGFCLLVVGLYSSVTLGQTKTSSRDIANEQSEKYKQAINDYEKTEFSVKIIKAKNFEEPLCKSNCEKKVLLGITFDHSDEPTTRTSARNTRDLIQGSAMGKYVYFPYYENRKILSDKEFIDVTPYTLASKIKEQLSGSLSAVVLYDGNGVDKSTKFPDGGVYLPESGDCEKLRKKLEAKRQDYYTASLEFTRNKALKDYQELNLKYREKVCHDRVLAYRDLISSLNGPDLLLFESSKQISGVTLSNEQYGLFDQFGGGQSREVKIYSANLTTQPESVPYIYGQSTFAKTFRDIQYSSDKIDLDHNCQISLNEVYFNRFKVIKMTEGLKDSLTPKEWFDQREDIKKNKIDFLGEKNSYSKSYQSAQNASGHTILFNPKNCDVTKKELDPASLKLLADSPSHRITEGTLAQFPKFLDEKKFEMDIAADMSLLNAQLADNKWDKFVYGKETLKRDVASMAAGAGANMAEGALQTADMALHPIETKDKITQGVSDYFKDEKGNPLSYSESMSKLSKDGKMLVEDAGKFVIKDCEENLCRSSVKATGELVTEVVAGTLTGAGVGSAASKVGTRLLKEGGELAADSAKLITKAEKAADVIESAVPDKTITKKVGGAVNLTEGADEAGLKEMERLGFKDFYEKKGSSPSSSIPNKTTPPLKTTTDFDIPDQKVSTVKPLKNGIDPTDSKVMQETQKWWNDLSKQARSSDPEVASKATRKIIEAENVIKEELGSGVPYRVLSRDELDSILYKGFVPEGKYFSHEGVGPHVGHGGNTSIIKLKNNSKTDQHFTQRKSDSGSGIQNEQKIPIEDLDVVVIDYKKIETQIADSKKLSNQKFADSDYQNISKLAREKLDEAIADTTDEMTKSKMIGTKQHLDDVHEYIDQNRAKLEAEGKNIERIKADIDTHDIAKVIGPSDEVIERHAFKKMQSFGDDPKTITSKLEEAGVPQAQSRKLADQLQKAIKDKEGKTISSVMNSNPEIRQAIKKYPGLRNQMAESMDHSQSSKDFLKRLGTKEGINPQATRQIALDGLGHDGPVVKGAWWDEYYKKVTGRNYITSKNQYGDTLQVADRVDQAGGIVRETENGGMILSGGTNKVRHELAGMYKGNDKGLIEYSLDSVAPQTKPQLDALKVKAASKGVDVPGNMDKQIERDIINYDRLRKDTTLYDKPDASGNIGEVKIDGKSYPFKNADEYFGSDSTKGVAAKWWKENATTYDSKLHETNNNGLVSATQKQAELCRGDNCSYTAYADRINRDALENPQNYSVKPGERAASALPSRGPSTIDVHPSNKINHADDFLKKKDQSGAVSVHVRDPKTGEEAGHVFSFDKGKFYDSQSGERFTLDEFKRRYKGVDEIYFTPDSKTVSPTVSKSWFEQTKDTVTKKVSGWFDNLFGSKDTSLPSSSKVAKAIRKDPSNRTISKEERARDTRRGSKQIFDNNEYRSGIVDEGYRQVVRPEPIKISKPGSQTKVVGSTERLTEMLARKNNPPSPKVRAPIIENVKGEDAVNGIAIRYKNPQTGEMEEGFVFGDKLGRHHSLISKAEDTYGKDVKVLWAGEAKIENGKITKMNEMAGILSEDPNLKNSVEGISAAQRISKNENMKDLFSDKPDFEKYVEAGENKHVMDGLESVSYMRHKAQNKITSLEMALNRQSRGKTLSPELIKVLQKDAQEVLKNFEVFSKIPGHGLNKAESFKYKSILREIANDGVIKPDEIKRLSLIQSKIRDKYLNPEIEFTLKQDQGQNLLGRSPAYTASVNATIQYLRPREFIPTHQLTMNKKQWSEFLARVEKDGEIKEPIKYVEINGSKFVVDGHHRLMAAERLGFDKIPSEKVELPYKGYKSVEDLISD